MTDTEGERFGLWDLTRPTLPKLKRAGPLARGVGLFALSRVRDHISIGCMIERHARRHPDRVFLQFEDRTYTYHQFNQAANRYAQVLKKSGLRAGDTVAVLMDNRPENLIAVVAVAKLGAAAAMCNTKQRGGVLAHSVNTVEPAAAIVGEELCEVFDEVRRDTGFGDGDRVWCVGDGGRPATSSAYRDLDAEAASQSAGNPSDTALVERSRPCFYIFTSGTTGLPKASVMSHTRWLRGGAGVGLGGAGLRSGDIFYCPLPLYHNNALTLAFSSVLCAGATLALARKFSVSGFWDDVRHHKATVFCYIGELCRYLLDQPESPRDRDHHVRTVVGNGLRPDIWDAFKERFGIEEICEFYGASEGNLVFVNGFNLDRTAGFCPFGFAVVEYDPETEAPVTDENGHMRRVEKGGVGLLLTKVTKMAPFEGYTDDAASEKKLHRDVFKKGDCWFDTGDLVRDQGMRHIAFVDRLGDTFRWKGENVATTEVENALNAHPQVAESVVYGVEVPGHDGRAGMAAITLEEGVNEVDWADLARHLKKELPAYAVPVFIRQRPEQAVTGTFKYRKVELKKEGYRPEGDTAVYVLPAGEDAYRELTEERRKALESGELRV